MKRASLLLALLGAACAPLPTPAPAEAAIVGGAPETGEPAVVFVSAVIGACTGTLIAPNVVLTAKHCVQTRGASGPVPVSILSAGVGPDRRSLRSYRVARVDTTPGGFFGMAITDGTDIALLTLRESIPDVTPIPIRRAPPTDLVGREVTAIGYGQRPDGGVGVKYRTTATLENVTPAVLTARNAICQGDSGGPIILEGPTREVVGVAAYGQLAGPMATCPAVLDAWNRVDVQLALIDRVLLRAGHCTPQGDEACNSLDDDCTFDEGCAALGEACETSADCALGPPPAGWTADHPPVECAMVGGARVCTVPCSGVDPALSCRALAHPLELADETALDGFYCARVEGSCGGSCAPGAPGPADNAAPCAVDTDCASLACGDVGGTRRCVTPCATGLATCPSGEACFGTADGCGVCVGASSVPAGRSLGEPCELPSHCASGACGDGGGARVCTQSCASDGECGIGLRCDAGFCAPGSRSGSGGTCRTDVDCVEGLSCVSAASGARYCARPCEDDLACTGDEACEAVGAGTACVSARAHLGEACEGRASCLEGECVASVCTALCGGTRGCPLGHRCVREGASTVCRAPPPASGGGCAIGRAGTRGWLAIALLAIARARVRRRAPRCGLDAVRSRR